ncbi:DotI/IcmL/TraM family protein [Salinimonas sp. HHU 13199]|uniref:DotI/IcmL/TraM family protein n=1 Tax=Salinimonas profundi TaxID=2729140 RepID=A0ABR8LPB7_9ALTE|nr:DotI/IcmL/TraM family protein [Salinimonas profundi]MBD3587587.1 DotI/IcmL/TraM family protein [Salinimonas profundi]
MTTLNAPQVVTITDELLEYALKQNRLMQKKLQRKMLLSSGLLAVIVGLGLTLAFDATELRLSEPVLVDEEGNTKVIPPIFNLENSLAFSAALADKYAMRLMNFHFLNLENQMQERRSLFVDDKTYEAVYRRPLQDADAFERIQKNNYIITAATIRNADLMAEFIVDGDLFIKYQIRLVQTAVGPSGEAESNKVILELTFKRVSRDEAIEGLLISDLGTIKR